MSKLVKLIINKRSPRMSGWITNTCRRGRRLATGFMANYYRSKTQSNKPEVSSLAVWGTTDELSGGSHTYDFTRDPCPCCGSSAGGKIRLNDRGRRKLAGYRKRSVA